MADKTVSIDDVRHMANLSRLMLDAEEERLFSRQFGQIISHMALLATVNTADLEPLYTPEESAANLREDMAINKRSQKEILSNAPETDGETFIVPRIV